jgi:hypothetical protein
MAPLPHVSQVEIMRRLGTCLVGAIIALAAWAAPLVKPCDWSRARRLLVQAEAVGTLQKDGFSVEARGVLAYQVRCGSITVPQQICTTVHDLQSTWLPVMHPMIGCMTYNQHGCKHACTLCLQVGGKQGRRYGSLSLHLHGASQSSDRRASGQPKCNPHEPPPPDRHSPPQAERRLPATPTPSTDWRSSPAAGGRGWFPPITRSQSLPSSHQHPWEAASGERSTPVVVSCFI